MLPAHGKESRTEDPLILTLDRDRSHCKDAKCRMLAHVGMCNPCHTSSCTTLRTPHDMLIFARQEFRVVAAACQDCNSLRNSCDTGDDRIKSCPPVHCIQHFHLSDQRGLPRPTLLPVHGAFHLFCNCIGLTTCEHVTVTHAGQRVLPDHR